MATRHRGKSILGATASKIKRIVTPVDLLVIESCPLHTESPEWAAHAPAQVEAACQRGAHVIGFTECGDNDIAEQLGVVCAKNGYRFFNDKGDTAIAYKATLTGVEVGNGSPTRLRVPTFVKFRFHNRTVTVIAMHWATNKPGNQSTRIEQTNLLIDDMNLASRSYNLGFFVGDSNPTEPLRYSDGEPQASLTAAGLPIIYNEVGFPSEPVGVTTIGRNSKDTAVSALSVKMFDALGSDHKPAVATYGVKRRRTLVRK